MNISDDPKCTFCGEENETIEHLLWNCSHTKAFITELKNQFQYKSIILDLNEKKFYLKSLFKHYAGVRNCISQVAEAGFYEKDSFLFTVDGLFLFIPVIYNSIHKSQSSTIGDYLILEDILSELF